MTGKKIRNITLYTCVICVLVVAGILLAQLWFQPFSEEVIFKIIVTCGVVVGVASIILVVKQFMDEEDRGKKDGFIN